MYYKSSPFGDLEIDLKRENQRINVSHGLTLFLMFGGNDMISFFMWFIFQWLLDPRPTEGPIKSPLSVCLSFSQFGVFLINGSLDFSDVR